MQKRKKKLLRRDEMEPNVFTELLSPVNLDPCDAWSPLKSTQNPFFLQISPNLEPLQKLILDCHARYFGRRTVWRSRLLLYRRMPCMALVTKSVVKQDKHDLQVSDGQITVKRRQNEVPRDWKKSFAKEYVILWLRVTVIHLALAIGFAISGLVIKSYRVSFFSTRTENHSHTNER